jgi:hypothetical protein
MDCIPLHRYHRLIITLLAVLVLGGSWLVPPDRLAREQASDGLQRALAVFAAARVLGGVISVVQNAEFDAKFLGSGITVAPGQTLQPLNELVDHFSTVMLMASVAFGVQVFLLNVGSHWLVSALLTATIALMLIASWQKPAPSSRWLRPVLVGLLLLRFTVPLTALANGIVYKTFFEHEYVSNLERIDYAVAEGQANPAKAEEGPVERVKRWFQRSTSPLDRLLKGAGSWSKTIVSLIAQFVVETVLLPLVFLLVLWRVARALAVWALPATAAPNRAKGT